MCGWCGFWIMWGLFAVSCSIEEAVKNYIRLQRQIHKLPIKPNRWWQFWRDD